jgi:HK97 family phage major capsid protein
MEGAITEVLAFPGDRSLKSLGDGKYGGYLVRYGTPKDTDLEGEFFSKETDLGVKDGGSLPVYYQHGMDGQMKAKRIGYGIVKYDDAGMWFEMQLEQRDDYEHMIAQLAEEGKLGLSSGAAGHLVTRESVGKSTHIKTWPIAEASLTPTPAEYRNMVTPVKTLLPAEPQGKTNGGNMDPVSTTQAPEVDLEAKIEAAVTKAIDTKVNAAIERAIEKVAKDLGPNNAGGIAVPNINTKTTLGNSNEQVKSFRHGIVTGDWVPYKAVMLGQVDAQGGYSVPDQFIPGIIAKRTEISIIRKMGVVPVPCTSDKLLVPLEDTAATKFVVTAENGAYDENEPTMTSGLGIMYKLTKLIKFAEELQEDSPDFDNYVQKVWGRSMALAENFYLVSGGTGSSMPQAMLNGASSSGITTASATDITTAELVQLLYAIGGAYADNLALVMRRATLGILRAKTGNPFQFSPMPSGEGNPINPGTIMGVPVYCTDAMPAATATNKAIMVCNPDFYEFGVREGLTVFQDPYTYRAANGLIGLLARFRMGGFVAQSEAFQYLTMHA